MVRGVDRLECVTMLVILLILVTLAIVGPLYGTDSRDGRYNL
jgi:hypothetical protein